MQSIQYFISCHDNNVFGQACKMRHFSVKDYQKWTFTHWFFMILKCFLNYARKTGFCHTRIYRPNLRFLNYHLFDRNLRNVKMCIVHFKFPFFSHFFTLTLPPDNRKRASCCRNKTTELWNRLTELS